MPQHFDLTTHDPSHPLSPRGFPQATRTLCAWQKCAQLLLVAALVTGACLDWRTELLALNAIVTVFYLATTLYRLLLIDTALRHPTELRFAKEKLARPPNGKQWPKYMVILPMYHEKDILPDLVEALGRLDYPKDRLEIRLLI
ncbi:MAG: hypothetical protein IJJ33_15295, partial [Victivallales bacterium]|nr:hypothetical protein [Victivallales bacterium]